MGSRARFFHACRSSSLSLSPLYAPVAFHQNYRMKDPEVIWPWLVVIFRLVALYLCYAVAAKLLVLLGPLLSVGNLTADFGWMLWSDFLIRVGLAALLFFKAVPLANLVIRGKVR